MWGEELGLIGDTGKNLDAAAHGEIREGAIRKRISAKRGAGKVLWRLQRFRTAGAIGENARRAANGAVGRHRRCF